jgi:hypothetical protein
MRKGLARVRGLPTGDKRSQSSQVLHICRRLLRNRDVGDQPVPVPDHPRPVKTCGWPGPRNGVGEVRSHYRFRFCRDTGRCIASRVY